MKILMTFHHSFAVEFALWVCYHVAVKLDFLKNVCFLKIHLHKRYI